jgi:HK97 family phage major capsid protein/HK97 family phage prohead protease
MPASTAVRIKAQTAETLTVEGYGVVFGGKDLMGDTFTPDTDFMLDYVPTKAVLYDHRLNDIPASREIIGKVVSIKRDETGLLVEAELDKKAKWMSVVEELLGKDALGWSSGSIGHMVDYERKSDGSVIKAWPIVEFSLTPTPAEPRTMAPFGPGVQRKSADELATSGSEAAAEGAAEAETQSAPDQPEAPVAVRIEVADEQEAIMADEVQAVESADVGAAVKALRDEIDGLKAELAKPVKTAGYEVGTPLKHAPSDADALGDMLLSIKRATRGDAKAVSYLERTYGAVKAMTEGTGQTGGYFVQQQEIVNRLTAMPEKERWLANIRREQVATPTGKWTDWDVTFTPTAGVGQTAGAARAKTANRAEGGAYTETTPYLKQLEWQVSDALSGYVKVSRELRQDSASAIGEVVGSRIRRAVNARTAFFVLNGTGVGQPLGILNSGALVQQIHGTATTFVYTDALNMISKFEPLIGQGMWVANRTNLPEIHVVAQTAGGYVTDMNREPGTVPMYGFEVFTSEHLPVTDTANSIVLIDGGSYIIFEYGPFYLEYSEHADFLNGNDVWRFGQRIDGKPILDSTIKEGNAGTATQVSPFVAAKFATS